MIMWQRHAVFPLPACNLIDQLNGDESGPHRIAAASLPLSTRHVDDAHTTEDHRDVVGLLSGSDERERKYPHRYRTSARLHPATRNARDGTFNGCHSLP